MNFGHDKFCEYHGETMYDTRPCTCEYLARVRADEREQTIRDCIAEVKKVGSRAAHIGFSRVGPLEVIAAVSTLQRKP